MTRNRRSWLTTNKARNDGLVEVVSISVEMHVTPAERSEPGDCTHLPPSRSRASKMCESVANFQEEVDSSARGQQQGLLLQGIIKLPKLEWINSIQSCLSVAVQGACVRRQARNSHRAIQFMYESAEIKRNEIVRWPDILS